MESPSDDAGVRELRQDSSRPYPAASRGPTSPFTVTNTRREGPAAAVIASRANGDGVVARCKGFSRCAGPYRNSFQRTSSARGTGRNAPRPFRVPREKHLRSMLLVLALHLRRLQRPRYSQASGQRADCGLAVVGGWQSRFPCRCAPIPQRLEIVDFWWRINVVCQRCGLWRGKILRA